ncbi:MAG: aminotransferase DegT, partial [Halobacteriovoraceae bacterium]|nr:aminotransferase DegT [Halobacteriovoraceae bacterium]
MPFIDLKTQYAAVKNGIGERINAVLDHGQYVMGPEVKELEGLLANFIGTKHCVAVSSGTDALLISLMALDLKPTDEVIVPDFSFFGTAE